MDMQNRRFGRKLINFGIMACFGMVPADRLLALEFGEFRLHSFLGQTLRASIPIGTAPGEQLDASCFSVGKPGAQSDGQLTYLTQVNLALEETGGRPSLRISTPRPINEPYVKLLVNATCGQGRYSREFTVLLDPPEHVAAAPAISEFSVPLPVVETGVAGVEKRSAPPPAAKKRRKAPAAVPAMPREAMAPAAASSGEEGQFRLKLSAPELDLSVVGSLSDEQRLKLRERQLLQDADDQVATSLSMKNRIKQLETQIGELQAALENTNHRLALSEKLAVSPATGAVDGVAESGAVSSGYSESFSLRNISLGVIAFLTLMVSVWWWRWRRNRVEERLAFGLEEEFPVDAMPHYSTEPNFQTIDAGVEPEPDPRTMMVEERESFDEDDELSRPTSMFDSAAEAVTLTEAESVLDEADLYLAYGWANRAIDLLQGYIEHHPEDLNLWKKLFETYLSQGMKPEFEQLALRCRATVEDQGLLRLARKLGRQLDPTNELYRAEEGDQETDASASRITSDIPVLKENAVLDIPLEFVLDEVDATAEKSPLSPGDADKTLGFEPLFPENREADEGGREPGGNKAAA